MNRRRTHALALVATALVTGMGTPTPSPTPTTSPSPSPSATQSDGTLQILTYRGYAEYGGVSPKVNWVGTFEKETGCRIARLDTVQTAEEMAARVTQRSYDVISAGPALAGALIADKLVQPVEPAKVSDYKDLTERFRAMTTVSGKAYGVPYLWGYHEFVRGPATTGSAGPDDVFASGRTALKDSPLTIADAALAEGSAKKPYELSEAALDKAMALLESGKDRTYWQNPIDLVKGFATGALDYAQVTPYLRVLLQKSGLPVETVATRTTTGWVDSWMLGANIPDTACAYRWLNWVTAANAQRDAAAWAGMAPANPKACKGRARAMCETYGVGDAKRIDRVQFAVRPPGGCAGEDGECTDYAAWADRWRELAE